MFQAKSGNSLTPKCKRIVSVSVVYPFNHAYIHYSPLSLFCPQQKNGDKKLDSTTPTIRVGKSVDDIDDLGTLGDYEFGEHDIF